MTGQAVIGRKETPLCLFSVVMVSGCGWRVQGQHGAPRLTSGHENLMVWANDGKWHEEMGRRAWMAGGGEFMALSGPAGSPQSPDELLVMWEQQSWGPPSVTAFSSESSRRVDVPKFSQFCRHLEADENAAD